MPSLKARVQAVSRGHEVLFPSYARVTVAAGLCTPRQKLCTSRPAKKRDDDVGSLVVAAGDSGGSGGNSRLQPMRGVTPGLPLSLVLCRLALAVGTVVWMIATHSLLVARECPHRHPSTSHKFHLFESPFHAAVAPQKELDTSPAPVIFTNTRGVSYSTDQDHVGEGTHVIGDWCFYMTRDANHWLHDHPVAADVALAAHALFYDILTLHYTVFGVTYSRTGRPIVGMFVLFTLRTLAQLLVHFPCPPGLYWAHPGVPTLSIDYTPAADFFFSGHTSSLVLMAMEFWVGGYRRTSAVLWLCLPAILYLLLVTRIHYTADIIAGLLAAHFASTCGWYWERLVTTATTSSRRTSDARHPAVLVK